MKLRKVHLALIVVAVAIAVMLGALAQGNAGVGRILRGLGDPGGMGERSPSVTAQDINIPETHHSQVQLFVLAGQSNMSGLGDMPETEMAANPQIYVFGNDYHWKLAQEPVDAPTHQVDRVSEDEAAGFGPSVAFATTVLEQRPDMVIGLIPCAKGGSSIHEWQRNLSDYTLYGSCLKRVRSASVMGTVAGVLFFQGEIDTVDPQESPERLFLPDQWADQFTSLVADLRRDFDSPELPVVFAQIGTNAEPDRFKNWAVVQAQQRSVKLPFTAMITTDDLPLMDYVHFTTASYQIIGQRFAHAYLDLLSRPTEG